MGGNLKISTFQILTIGEISYQKVKSKITLSMKKESVREKTEMRDNRETEK